MHTKKKNIIIMPYLEKGDSDCSLCFSTATLTGWLKDGWSVGKTCLSPSRSPAHRSATQGAVSFMGPPPHTALIAPFYISASQCFHLCICAGKGTSLANWWSGDGCCTRGWPLDDGGPKGWGKCKGSRHLLKGWSWMWMIRQNGKV